MIPGGRHWVVVRDGDPDGYALYRRHYSSAKSPRPKQRQFVGPGGKLVLLGLFTPALFVWRKFRDRSGQTGVNCAVFRNEGSHRSSDMVREAMAFAWNRWPGARLYTYVNPKKVRSQNPGYCFLCAGWRRCGRTKGGLLVLEATPEPG